MNSENSKTFLLHRLLLNLLLDKINLRRTDKCVALSTFAFTIHLKM